MSTAIGNRLVNGSGVKYHSGQGIARTIASKAFELGANAVVQKIAGAIKGSGFKLAGTGKRKVGRPKTHRKKKC